MINFVSATSKSVWCTGRAGHSLKWLFHQFPPPTPPILPLQSIIYPPYYLVHFWHWKEDSVWQQFDNDCKYLSITCLSSKASEKLSPSKVQLWRANISRASIIFNTYQHKHTHMKDIMSNLEWYRVRPSFCLIKWINGHYFFSFLGMYCWLAAQQ